MLTFIAFHALIAVTVTALMYGWVELAVWLEQRRCLKISKSLEVE